MNCEICFEVYDKQEHKPMTIIPCGHTYCLKCLEKIKDTPNYKCKQCNEQISEHKPSYAIIKILDNLAVDFNSLNLRQSVHDLVNQINETKTNIYLMSEKKLQDDQYKINTIKNEISNQTTDFMNYLLNNQEKIIRQADKFHRELVTSLNIESAEEEKFLNDTETKDLNELNRKELNEIKTELFKIKTNLVFKSNLLKEIDLNLESNNYAFNRVDFKTGEIVEKNSFHSFILPSLPNNNNNNTNNNEETRSVLISSSNDTNDDNNNTTRNDNI
jgi:hypothetical protein